MSNDCLLLASLALTHPPQLSLRHLGGAPLLFLSHPFVQRSVILPQMSLRLRRQLRQEAKRQHVQGSMLWRMEMQASSSSHAVQQTGAPSGATPTHGHRRNQPSLQVKHTWGAKVQSASCSRSLATRARSSASCRPICDSCSRSSTGKPGARRCRLGGRPVLGLNVHSYGCGGLLHNGGSMRQRGHASATTPGHTCS